MTGGSREIGWISGQNLSADGGFPALILGTQP
jgi:hypothetical protein